jgi:NAD(P)-dependent dehydrogenase (short-subunit alcohol dehydrogenase family)
VSDPCELGSISQALATKLTANGYKVALGSRSGQGGDQAGTIPVKVDVTKSAEVSAAFAESERTFRSPVNVVVYNGN